VVCSSENCTRVGRGAAWRIEKECEGVASSNYLHTAWGVVVMTEGRTAGARLIGIIAGVSSHG